MDLALWPRLLWACYIAFALEQSFINHEHLHVVWNHMWILQLSQKCVLLKFGLVQLIHYLLVVIIMTRTINILVAFKITRKIAIQPLSCRLPSTGHHWNLDFGGQNFPIRYISTFSSSALLAGWLGLDVILKIWGQYMKYQAFIQAFWQTVSMCPVLTFRCLAKKIYKQ